MTGIVSIDKREFKGNTFRWVMERFLYSIMFTALSLFTTVLFTILLIPIAQILPQGLTIYVLLAVLTAISSGEILTQYNIEISLPDTENVFRRDLPENSGKKEAPTDKFILGLMVAGGTNGMFLIVLLVGALSHFVTPVGSLAIPILVLYIDRHLFKKYSKSLTFGGANLVKWVLKRRSITGREIKRLDLLHAAAVSLLGFSQGTIGFGNENYS